MNKEEFEKTEFYKRMPIKLANEEIVELVGVDFERGMLTVFRRNKNIGVEYEKCSVLTDEESMRYHARKSIKLPVVIKEAVNDIMCSKGCNLREFCMCGNGSAYDIPQCVGYDCVVLLCNVYTRLAGMEWDKAIEEICDTCEELKRIEEMRNLHMEAAKGGEE